MNVKKIGLSLFALFFLFSFHSDGQELWRKLEKESYSFQKKEIKTFKNFPKKHALYQLDFNQLQKITNFISKAASKTILLPNSEGSLSKFLVTETSNFEAKLKTKFPNITSYSAQGIDDPTAVAKISIGADGFHAVIFAANGKTVYVDPYSMDNQQYIVYKTSDLKEEDVLFKCEVEENVSKQSFLPEQLSRVNDGNLRTYRLALVCSGEYAQFHLDNQGVSATASERAKKTAVLSAMNTTMTRVNGVFEKDLAVKMVLVDNNDEVIFLDANTDNISDGDAGTMIDEVQAIADAQIGSANYDIGHIFSIGGSGLAGLGVVCLTGQKARGVTGRSSPIGDPYDIDYVAHEMGHQFGATHTQNNSCNRTNSTAVEPGSASTIMGYAGICEPNVQTISDAYFHAVSITQMQQNIAATGNCATLVSNDNSPPIAEAGLNYSIPKATPFILKGTATDVDGTASLTYNWEQIDSEVGTMPPLATNTVGPMFRSLPSSISPNRYFPALETIVSGTTETTWEVLPGVARTLNFSFLVRDNNTTGGANSRENMTVNVTDADAFTVTSQNSEIVWIAGSSQTVTWNKGSSDIAPINCQNVTIKLSKDGGLTFPITLLENTPNDGTQEFLIPEYVTQRARIMVAAVDNVFYNVNSTNFEILSSQPTFILKNTSGEVSACNDENESVNFILNLDFINDFKEDVSFEASGHPLTSSILFSPSIINVDGDVVLSISNLDGVDAQDYDINVRGTSSSVTQDITITLKVVASDLEAVTLETPLDGAAEVALSDLLTWQEDSSAVSYIVEVATDVNFTQIVSQGAVNTNAYETTNLEIQTLYFWRVKAKNSCSEGGFSNTFSFTTDTASYCASTFTDEAGGAEHIINVSFNGIDNTSDNDLIDGYQNFTEINTNVLRDQTRDISVTFDTAGFQNHCYVFIDWNQDFVFDSATETYDLGTKTEDIATATFAIKVPLGAKLGKTTMRVLIEYDDPTNGFGLGACDADHLTEWGETEDYSITVVLPLLAADNYVLTATNESIYNAKDGQITIGVEQEEFSYELAITGPDTDRDISLSGSNTYVLAALAPGRYFLCIEAVEAEDTQCFEIDIVEGAVIVDLDNYTIKTTSETCVDQNDGRIDILIKQEIYTYKLKITGLDTNIDISLVGFSYALSGLAPGVYEICILVAESDQQDCFEVVIEGSQPISLKVASDKTAGKYTFNIDSGTAPFSVYLNHKLLHRSSETDFEIELQEGGTLEVKTAKECEGVYRAKINAFLLLQNPVINTIDLLLPLGTEKSRIETLIYDINGKLVFKKMVSVENNMLSIPFQNFLKGIYILKLPTVANPIKILKK